MQKIIRENPNVDVILPNYNKAEFLEEAINSVITQSYKNWHMYIVDDNSSDNSWNVIKKFLDLKNITAIRLSKNKGPSFCRNYAMRISKSKYIAFIDSDDSWIKSKLEKQLYFMEKNNFSFTYTDYTPFFEKNGLKKIKKRTFLKDYFKKTGFKKAVIGLSGGIDSALTAAIAADSLGNENVIGVSMPSKFSSEHSKSDARELAEKLGIQFEMISIHKSYNQIIGKGEEQYEKHKKKIFKKLYIFSHDHHGHYMLSYRIFKDHKIFGTGTKGFRYLCRNKIYTIDNPALKVFSDGCSTHPHNTYAQILVSNGLIGFFLLTFAFFYILKEIFLCRKKIKGQTIFDKNEISKAIAISAIFINIWPLIPSGNFFNNWLSMLYFYPIGFYLYFKHINEKKIS